jgi:hypothetical protein
VEHNNKIFANAEADLDKARSGMRSLAAACAQIVFDTHNRSDDVVAAEKAVKLVLQQCLAHIADVTARAKALKDELAAARPSEAFAIKKRLLATLKEGNGLALRRDFPIDATCDAFNTAITIAGAETDLDNARASIRCIASTAQVALDTRNRSDDVVAAAKAVKQATEQCLARIADVTARAKTLKDELAGAQPSEAAAITERLLATLKEGSGPALRRDFLTEETCAAHDAAVGRDPAFLSGPGPYVPTVGATCSSITLSGPNGPLPHDHHVEEGGWKCGEGYCSKAGSIF